MVDQLAFLVICAIETTTWNEDIGRYEFQLIHDYRNGDAKALYASRDVCAQCHHNLGPIFSDNLWQDTNGVRSIARLVEQARGSRDPYHGAPIFQGDSDFGRLSETADKLMRKANGGLLGQRLWAKLCGNGADGATCRREGLTSVIQDICGKGAAAATTWNGTLGDRWAGAGLEEAIFRSSVIRDREPLNLLAKELPVPPLPPEAGLRPRISELASHQDPEVRGERGLREKQAANYRRFLSQTSATAFPFASMVEWLKEELRLQTTRICASLGEDLATTLTTVVTASPEILNPPLRPRLIAAAMVTAQRGSDLPPELALPTEAAPPDEESTVLTATDPNINLFYRYCGRCHKSRLPYFRAPETAVIQMLRSSEWRSRVLQRLDWIAGRPPQTPPSSAMPRIHSREYELLTDPNGLRDHEQMLRYLSTPVR